MKRRSYSCPPHVMLSVLKLLKVFNDGQIYVVMADDRYGIGFILEDVDWQKVEPYTGRRLVYVFEKETDDNGEESVRFVEAFEGE